VPPIKRKRTLMNSWVGVVGPEPVCEALTTIFDWPETERHDRCAYGVSQAQGYNWDVLVRDYWAPFLQEAEEQMAEGKAAVA